MGETRLMAVVTEPGKVELQERPVPELGPTDVRIAVRAATLCGSDLHIFKGKHPSVTLPVPVGHELAGVVEQVGAEVTRVEPGDPVAVEPVLVCGTCHFCQRGQYHLCSSISFQYRRGQGALTTVFVADEKWVHLLGEGASFAEGAMLEPLSVAVHALRKSGFSAGETSAIFGDGAIGLLLLQLVRLAGGGAAFVVGVRDFRLQAALEMGAARAFNNLKEDAIEQIYAHTGGLGVDRSFEAVGLNETLVQTLQSLKKGGTATLVGLFESPEVTIPANLFVQREIALVGSQGYAWDFQLAGQFLASGQVNLKRLITHEFPLSAVQEAFAASLDPAEEALKVVVNPER